MDKLWRGVFSNPIMKHHRTGSHGEHVVPMMVKESGGDFAEDYDSDIENEYPYEELKRLGDGDTDYLFRVMVAGGGSVVYDYIVALDSTSTSEFDEAVRAYDIPVSDRPSPGFYPDIYEGLALVIADQLGVPREKLGPENLPPFDRKIVTAAVQEVAEQ